MKLGRVSLGLSAALAGVLLSGCRAVEISQQEKMLTEYRAAGNEAYFQGDFERAGEEYGRYVAERPNEPDVRYRLGICDLEMGRLASARTHLGIAHDMQPTREEFTLGLGRAIVAGGNEEELYGFLRNLMDSAVNAQTYITVGQIAFFGGLHDEAERAFMSSATLVGNTSATPHRELARFYESIGDSESEMTRWRMVLSFDIADVEANARLRELGVIPGPSMALEPEAGSPGG